MILSCGEALIDMLPRMIEGEGDAFLPVVGGAVFNTAIALGRLGENAGYFSSLSTDLFGDQLVDALNASSVDTSLCPRSGQPTTLAFVKLTNGQAQYSFFDENSAGRSLRVDQIPALSNEIVALHFGAISLIPEPSGSSFESMMAQNTNRVLSLDPNIRADFIDDEAAHRARINRMIAMADIVKVSDEDLDWIAQGASGSQTIDQWLTGATSIVIETRGAHGVTAYTSNGAIDQAAQKVEIVDTIGAGDTFNSGFLAGLRRSGLLSKSALANADPQDLRPALELAVKVAAVTVSRPGANPPWQSEL